MGAWTYLPHLGLGWAEVELLDDAVGDSLEALDGVVFSPQDHADVGQSVVDLSIVCFVWSGWVGRRRLE